MSGTAGEHSLSMLGGGAILRQIEPRPWEIEGNPPNEDNEVFVTGLVLFVAQLSASFFTFTIEQSDGKALDIVAGHKRASARVRLSRIAAEVKRCQDEGIPVTVRGFQPFDKCSCREGCQSDILHCWNVNNLPMPCSDEPLFCQEIGQRNDSRLLPLPSQPTPASTLEAASNAIQLSENVELNNAQTQSKRKRIAVKNRGRAARFVELLIEIIGADVLRAPSSVGVLDIAGGGSNAGITFELSLRRGMESIVIDPRAVKLNKTQRNTLQFRKDNRERLQPGLEISHQAAALTKRFREWKPSQLQVLFDEDFAASEIGNHLLRDCVAVVGMHPDEATDAIIQLAMRYDKPWMICPCCVFPRTFKRILPDGQAVKTYDELCKYIRNISTNVQEATLDFEGRNKVFYWLPAAHVE